MARSRMIRPGFFMDEKLGRRSTHARMLYQGMWFTSDDYGNTGGHPGFLKGHIFSFQDESHPDGEMTEARLVKLLSELESSGFIVKYKANDETLYHIPKFLDHQKIKNPSQMRNPEFKESLRINSTNSYELQKTSPETETETETETEVKQKQKSLSSKLDDRFEILFVRVIGHLNQLTGKKYRTSAGNRSLIHARYKEGWAWEDFEKVHRIKTKEWLGTEREKYLRPITLYNPNKFESYWNEPEATGFSDKTAQRLKAAAAWVQSKKGGQDDRSGEICGPDGQVVVLPKG